MGFFWFGAGVCWIGVSFGFRFFVLFGSYVRRGLLFVVFFVFFSVSVERFLADLSDELLEVRVWLAGERWVVVGGR